MAVIRVIPRADFKSNWVKNATVLEKNELALILNDKGYPYVPSMVIGDGKTRAFKCRMVSPYAYLEIDTNEETGETKIYRYKEKEDYKWLYRYIRERNKAQEEKVAKKDGE